MTLSPMAQSFDSLKGSLLVFESEPLVAWFLIGSRWLFFTRSATYSNIPLVEDA